MGNKRVKVILYLLGIAILGYSFAHYIQMQKSLLEQITYSPVGISASNVSTNNVTIRLDLQIINPSDISATLESMVLNIYFQGKLIGTSVLDRETVIPAAIGGVPSANIVPITTTIDPSQIWKDGIGTLTSIFLTKNVNLLVNGSMMLRSSFIKKEVAVNYYQTINVL